MDFCWACTPINQKLWYKFRVNFWRTAFGCPCPQASWGVCSESNACGEGRSRVVSVSGIDRERAGSKTKMVFLMPSSFTVYLCIIRLYCWEKKSIYCIIHNYTYILRDESLLRKFASSWNFARRNQNCMPEILEWCGQKSNEILHVAQTFNYYHYYFSWISELAQRRWLIIKWKFN